MKPTEKFTPISIAVGLRYLQLVRQLFSVPTNNAVPARTWKDDRCCRDGCILVHEVSHECQKPSTIRGRDLLAIRTAPSYRMCAQIVSCWKRTRAPPKRESGRILEGFISLGISRAIVRLWGADSPVLRNNAGASRSGSWKLGVNKNTA